MPRLRFKPETSRIQKKETIPLELTCSVLPFYMVHTHRVCVVDTEFLHSRYICECQKHPIDLRGTGEMKTVTCSFSPTDKLHKLNVFLTVHHELTIH